MWDHGKMVAGGQRAFFSWTEQHEPPDRQGRLTRSPFPYVSTSAAKKRVENWALSFGLQSFVQNANEGEHEVRRGASSLAG